MIPCAAHRLEAAPTKPAERRALIGASSAKDYLHHLAGSPRLDPRREGRLAEQMEAAEREVIVAVAAAWGPAGPPRASRLEPARWRQIRRVADGEHGSPQAVRDEDAGASASREPRTADAEGSRDAPAPVGEVHRAYEALRPLLNEADVAAARVDRALSAIRACDGWRTAGRRQVPRCTRAADCRRDPLAEARAAQDRADGCTMPAATCTRLRYAGRQLRRLRREVGLDPPMLRQLLAVIEPARQRWARGRDELVRGHMWLVSSFARKFSTFGVELFDLTQEGAVGLMRAAERYDFRRGVRFATYAGWWVRQAMQKAVTAQGRTVRVPAQPRRRIQLLNQARRRLQAKLGREPDVDELAAEAAVSEADVRNLQDALLPVVSLDTAPEEWETTPRGERLADLVHLDPEQTAIQRAREGELLAALETLTDTEQQVVRLRFGIDQSKPRSLQAIGVMLGYTREGIRQVELRALRKLRQQYGGDRG